MSNKDLRECIQSILECLGAGTGEDVFRQGLLDTSNRVSEALSFMTSGYKQSPKDVLKTFEDGASGYDELIFQGSIPFYSLCEHHLLPFFGVAHIGYIPNGKIVGLSKLVKLVDIFARRLQVQERATTQILDALDDTLNPMGAGVVLCCRHLCMESRGVRTQGTVTITSAIRGVLKDSASAKAEFMGLVSLCNSRGAVI